LRWNRLTVDLGTLGAKRESEWESWFHNQIRRGSVAANSR
jgi:hypothetical protein